MVGQRHHVQPRTGSRSHDIGMGLGAIGDIGVGMQVNPHLSSVVDREQETGEACSLSRDAGETMVP